MKYLLGLATLFTFFSFDKKRREKAFLSFYEQRGSDLWGSGSFGASRDGGKRTHKGLDLKYSPKDKFRIPFDSVLKRKGIVYSNDYKYKLVEFKGLGNFSEFTYKVMYFVCQEPIGTIFNRGEFVGSVQDITEKYKGITNHVHFELYIDGKLVNPENYV